MKKRNKIALLAGLLSVVVGLGVYVYQYEGEFAVEFGDSQEARDAFITLLKEHEISHQVRTDHLGSVWIVPDKLKREEYESVRKIWDARREEEVRKLNEARGL